MLPSPMPKIRVVSFGLGPIGLRAAQLVLSRSSLRRLGGLAELELVGAIDVDERRQRGEPDEATDLGDDRLMPLNIGVQHFGDLARHVGFEFEQDHAAATAAEVAEGIRKLADLRKQWEDETWRLGQSVASAKLMKELPQENGPR